MSAIPIIHPDRRVARPGLWPWGLAALAIALLVPHAALATEVPFGAQSVISTSADDAFAVFAADVDADGDTDALSASFLDDKIASYENNGASPPVQAFYYIVSPENGCPSNPGCLDPACLQRPARDC